MDNSMDTLMIDLEHFKQEALNMVESIGKDMDQLQEKLLKLNVRAHMLEVDIATQFSPDVVLQVEKLDQKCQESINISKEIADQILKLTDR